MNRTNKDGATLLSQIKKWQSEAQEALAGARKSGDHSVVVAFETYVRSLEQLLKSIEEPKEPFANDFWTEDSMETKTSQLVDQVIMRVSNLKLPTLSKATHKTEATIARRGH